MEPIQENIIKISSIDYAEKIPARSYTWWEKLKNSFGFSLPERGYWWTVKFKTGCSWIRPSDILFDGENLWRVVAIEGPFTGMAVSDKDESRIHIVNIEPFIEDYLTLNSEIVLLSRAFGEIIKHN